MPIVSTVKPAEQSTGRFTFTLIDDFGEPFIPNNDLVWKLTDQKGRVINGRSAVALAPAETVVIMLTGDDLAIGSLGTRRVITVTCTYDNDVQNDLDFKDEIRFSIEPLVGVS